MKKIVFAIAIILMSVTVNAQQRYLDGVYSLKHSSEEQEILSAKKRQKGENYKEYKTRVRYESQKIHHKYNHKKPRLYKDECEFCQNEYDETVKHLQNEIEIISDYSAKISEAQKKADYLAKEIPNIQKSFVQDYEAKNDYLRDSISASVKEKIKVAEQNYLSTVQKYASKFSPNLISNLNNIIDDVHYGLGSPNSVGGCDFYFYAKNKNKKTIKYIYISVSFKNAVDDYVYDEIRDYKTVTAKLTGPIGNKETIEGEWECLIYNSTATTPIVNSVKIEYMDKSSVTLTRKEIEELRKFVENKPDFVIEIKEDREIYFTFQRMGRTEYHPTIVRLSEEHTKPLKEEMYDLRQKIYDWEKEKTEHEKIIRKLQEDIS